MESSYIQSRTTGQIWGNQQTMKLFIVTKKSLKIKKFPKTSKGCHGSTYLFKLIAVKKQIAMLLDIVHFKDRHGSTYFSH